MSSYVKMIVSKTVMTDLKEYDFKNKCIRSVVWCAL